MPDASLPNARRKIGLVTLLVLMAAVGVFAWLSGKPGADPAVMQQIRAGNLDRAEALLDVRLDEAGDNPVDLFAMARVLRKQGDIKECQRQLKRAVELGGENRVADIEMTLAQAQIGQIEPVQARLEELLATGEADGREVLEAYINGLLISGRVEQAEHLIDVWTRTYPDDPRAHYFNARQRMYYGQTDAVIKSCLASLSHAPDSGPAAYLLGKAYVQQNESEDALTQFSHASEQLRFNSAALLEKAKVLRVLGRAADARRILEELAVLSADEIRNGFLRVGDRYEGAPVALELGSLEVASENPTEAIRWLETAVEAMPHDLAARQALGLAYRSVGRNDDAKQELAFVRDTRAALREVDHLVDKIESDPSLVDERIDVGELYLKHASSATAEFWLKTALARDTKNVRGHRLLAELYTLRAKRDPTFRDAAREHQKLADRYDRESAGRE